MSVVEACELCLSTERTVTAMHDTQPAYQTFIKWEEVQACGTEKLFCIRVVQLCWECRAILQKFHRFKAQTYRAKQILEEMQAQGNVAESHPLQCLSNLGYSIKTSYDSIICYDSDSCTDNVETLTYELDVKSEIDFDDGTDFEVFVEAGPIDVEDPITNDTQIKIEQDNTNIDITTNDNDNNYVVTTKVELEPLEVKSKCDERLKKLTKHKLNDKELYKKHMKLKTGREDSVSTNDKGSKMKMAKELVSTKNKATRQKEDFVSEDLINLAEYKEKFISTDSKEKLTMKNKVDFTRKRQKSKIECATSSTFKENTPVGIMEICKRIYATAEKIYKIQKSCDASRFISKCVFCNETFDTEEESQRHRETHLNDAKLRRALCCRLCRHITRGTADMRKHCRSEHPHIPVYDKKPFTCSVCGLNFSRYYFEKHNCTRPQPNKYQCYKCSAVYKQRKQILRHLLNHEMRYLCDICGKRFCEQRNLKVHYGLHFSIDARPHACTLCHRKYITKDKLADHMIFHKGIKPFACDQCDRRFRLKPELNRHKKQRHATGQFVVKPKVTRTKSLFRNEPLIVDKKTGPVRLPEKLKEAKKLRSVRLESYPCKLCGKNFTQKNSLDAHSVFHTGDRPHKCDECDLSFKYQSGLWSHKLLHKGVKPHQCTVCGAQFTLKGNLSGHMKVHSNDKPYECDTCGQRFPWRRNLKNHFQVHAKQ